MPPTPQHQARQKSWIVCGYRICFSPLACAVLSFISLSLVQCERTPAGGSGNGAREGGIQQHELVSIQASLPEAETVLYEPKQEWPAKQDDTELGGFSGHKLTAEKEAEWERIIKERGEDHFRKIVQELEDERDGLRLEMDGLRAGAFRDPKSRREYAEKLAAWSRAEKMHAWAQAKLLGIETAGRGSDGKGFELLRFKDGLPVYRTTYNENAAISNAANLVGAGTTYDLTGLGLRVGVWDESSVRASHQEFGGRITQVDSGGSYLSSHQTHVSGTIGASGVNSKAKGMAVEVEVRNHDWNDDLAEMTTESAATPSDLSMLPVSNHSYGFLMGWEYGSYSGNTGYHFFGDFSKDEDSDFGKYIGDPVIIDEICSASGYYLPFWSAGNDRNDGPAEGATIYYWNGSSWQSTSYNPDNHPDTEKNLQYDTIGGSAVAKNIMTVGAVNDAVVSGERSVEAGTMASFSSWGPTDDGRIKPDIVANGVDLFSTDSSRDNGYSSKSGTSMSSPSAAGGSILIQERYGEYHAGELMMASTLKALIIHTADDLGNVGPDYSNGWGLMNVKSAVDLIDLDFEKPSNQHLVVDSVSAGTPSHSYRLLWDQNSSVMKATICWTDPAGDEANGVVDSSTPVLVNDLDIRIVSPSGQTLMPWVLDKDSPQASATSGDNTLDNVEQIIITDPEPGEYVLTVSYKGSITGASQVFSLITTGQDQASVGVFPVSQVSSRGIHGQLPSPSEHQFRVVNNTGSDSAWTVSSNVSWLNLSLTAGTATAGSQSVIDAELTPSVLDMSPGTYTATLTFTSSSFENVYQREVQLTIYEAVPPSEQFAVGDGFDLKNTQLTFLPSSTGYAVFKAPATYFPVDTQLGSEALHNVSPDFGNSDDGHWTRNLAQPLTFYGQSVSSLNIGTNGLVRFGSSANDYTESISEHFANLGIAVLWDDLNPASAGAIYYQEFPGAKIVVTYEGVPEYGSNVGNSVQLELFTDGTGIIRLTYLDINSADNIIGLSDGQGVPAGWPFPETNFDQAHDYPVLTFDIQNNNIREGDGSMAAITANLSEKPPVPMEFPLRFLGGAELADVSGMPEVLNFPVFEPEQTYLVQAVDEDLMENTEMMEIQVESHPLLDFIGSWELVILDASNLPTPLAKWLLDETNASDDAIDSSGNGFDAEPSLSGVSVVAGKHGNARYLDGVDGCFTFGALGAVGNELTLSGWFKRDGDQTNGVGLIFHRMGGQLFGLQLGSSMDLRYRWNTSDGQQAWSSGLIMPDQVWVFVALVIRPDGATIYMHDGTSMQSASTAMTHAVSDWTAVSHLGCDPIANRHFKGAIDDCRIYPLSFSDRDMEFLFREGLSSVEQYAFDSGVPDQNISAELDPDLDGLPNLLELALATDPNSPDNPVIHEFVDGKIKLKFDRQNEELVYVEGEWSNDLVNWYASGFVVTEEGVEIPMDQDTKFIRLRATEVSP
ncbi:hypothetical protein Rhal01_01226 [Rubritalea halochordaticola]|uniref:Peptidase S8/S53 domain-containing protein n=1 Tax=Rubritalea halochordaticola TaxID=714537 RepID=A0ABP9UX62_9BACT